MKDDFKKNILIASLISLLFHTLIVLVLGSKKDNLKVKKYSVINLASFKDYVVPEIKKQIPKKNEMVTTVEEPIVEKPIVDKPIVEKPIVDKPIVEKPIVEKPIVDKPIVEKPKTLEKKKTFKDEIFENVQQKKKRVEEKKVFENLKGIDDIFKEPSKEFKTKKNIVPKDTEILNDADLIKYFNNIVEEMTILARKSYPRQSRMFKEQGKIIIDVTLNSSGQILNINLITKEPKRLAKAAEKLLKKKRNFPPPPKKLFKTNDSFSFEIPINFILN